MFDSRAGVALLTVALTASTSCAQPDGMFDHIFDEFDGGDPILETVSRHSYTAFPEILTPKRESKWLRYADGTELTAQVHTAAGPQPVLPALPVDASALQKVRDAQVREGLRYLALVTEDIRRGNWTEAFFRQYANMIPDVYRIGAELEDTPAKRVRWYEARVRKLKEFERYQLIRIVNGSNPPVRYDYTQFVRLGAEAELLKLRSAVNRPGDVAVPFPMPRPQRPGAVRPVGALEPVTPKPQDDPDARITPTFTVFRDLKPGTVETRALPEGGGKIRLAYYIDTAVVPPRIPVLAADAPPLRRVRYEQVLEGLTCLQHLADLMRAGDWNLSYFDETLETALNTYRLGGELETDPADRVPLYEARVRVLKELELLTEARVKNRYDSPHRLSVVRFQRHGAEADLLVLLDEVKQFGPSKGAPVKRAAFEFKLARPTWTAFPNLNPPIRVQRPNADPARANPDIEFEEKDVVPVPPLPVLAADAPPLPRVQYQQLRAGLDHGRWIKLVIEIGSWTSQYTLDHLDMLMRTFPVGAEFETEPDKRAAWYEACIARLKGFERFIENRVKNGTDRPDKLCLVRLARLQAEAELLRHRTDVSRAPTPRVSPLGGSAHFHPAVPS
jgi:hypothetical protein